MLFILAFDHRNSFRTQFFGLSGAATAAEDARCRDGKAVIYEGLLAALEQGPLPGTPGCLCDDEYGLPVLRAARAAGIVVAVPVEASGRAELAWQHEPFGVMLEQLQPNYAKVLVRYNPDGDAAMNDRQRQKLLALQAWLGARGTELMLELLVPAEPEQFAAVGGDQKRFDVELRPALTVGAVTQLTDARLAPALWKLEGMASTDQYAAIAAAACDRRADSRCLVLGRGEDRAAVEQWLSLAAPVSGFAGFAVGRTLWWQPLREYFNGTCSRREAAVSIGENYRQLVVVYAAAAAAAAGG